MDFCERPCRRDSLKIIFGGLHSPVEVLIHLCNLAPIFISGTIIPHKTRQLYYSYSAFLFVNLWHSWLCLIESVPYVHIFEVNSIHLPLPFSNIEAVLPGLQIL